jgi:hypothetical protein
MSLDERKLNRNIKLSSMNIFKVAADPLSSRTAIKFSKAYMDSKRLFYIDRETDLTLHVRSLGALAYVLQEYERHIDPDAASVATTTETKSIGHYKPSRQKAENRQVDSLRYAFMGDTANPRDLVYDHNEEYERQELDESMRPGSKFHSPNSETDSDVESVYLSEIDFSQKSDFDISKFGLVRTIYISDQPFIEHFDTDPNDTSDMVKQMHAAMRILRDPKCARIFSNVHSVIFDLEKDPANRIPSLADLSPSTLATSVSMIYRMFLEFLTGLGNRIVSAEIDVANVEIFRILAESRCYPRLTGLYLKIPDNSFMVYDMLSLYAAVHSTFPNVIFYRYKCFQTILFPQKDINPNFIGSMASDRYSQKESLGSTYLEPDLIFTKPRIAILEKIFEQPNNRRFLFTFPNLRYIHFHSNDLFLYSGSHLYNTDTLLSMTIDVDGGTELLTKHSVRELQFLLLYYMLGYGISNKPLLVFRGFLLYLLFQFEQSKVAHPGDARAITDLGKKLFISSTSTTTSTEEVEDKQYGINSTFKLFFMLSKATKIYVFDIERNISFSEEYNSYVLPNNVVPVHSKSGESGDIAIQFQKHFAKFFSDIYFCSRESSTAKSYRKKLATNTSVRTQATMNYCDESIPGSETWYQFGKIDRIMTTFFVRSYVLFKNYKEAPAAIYLTTYDYISENYYKLSSTGGNTVLRTYPLYF